MLIFLIWLNIITILFWLWSSDRAFNRILAAEDAAWVARDERREALERAVQNASEAGKWFRCTRIAHARRKRLQRVLKRITHARALEGIEHSLLIGERDEAIKSLDRMNGIYVSACFRNQEIAEAYNDERRARMESDGALHFLQSALLLARRRSQAANRAHVQALIQDELKKRTADKPADKRTNKKGKKS